MGVENENSPNRRLTYVDSQEPDELSQVEALIAVDRFISIEEDKQKENMYNIILHNNNNEVVAETNSELNLSAKVVKYLSTQHEDKHLVRKMNVFDWVDPSHEEGRNCGAYDVGPSTQMAAEVLEELFNASLPISPVHPNNIEETNLGNEMTESDREHCVFRHPKRRRTMLHRTPRLSVLGDQDGCLSDRLPLIMDTVKRKKRSPFIRQGKSKHGNLRGCTEVGCQENDKVSMVGELSTRYSDFGMNYPNERMNNRHKHALHVDNTRRLVSKRRNKSSVPAIRVIFSQNLDPKVVRQQKKVLSQFGASIVLSMSDATHFVADRFARTKNMMEAIAMGRHVVRHDWLDSCAKTGCFVSEEKFILRDLMKEREIGFSMSDSIQHAKRFPLLEGWRVLITPKARPNKELLKCLVKVSHGQLVERLSRYTMVQEDNVQGKFFVISCKEDYQMCSQLLDIGIKVYDSELLLNGIVTQKLAFERHRLFVGNS